MSGHVKQALKCGILHQSCAGKPTAGGPYVPSGLGLPTLVAALHKLQASEEGQWHNPAVTILQELEIAEKEGRKLRREGDSKKERVKEEEEARPSGALDTDGPTPMDTQTSGLDERLDALRLSLLIPTS